MTQSEAPAARIFHPNMTVTSDVEKVQDSSWNVWHKVSANGTFWASESGAILTLTQIRNRSRFLVEVL